MSTGHDVNNVVATIVTQTTGDTNVRLRTEEVWIEMLKSKNNHRDSTLYSNNAKLPRVQQIVCE